jgi:hypothetical protein
VALYIQQSGHLTGTWFVAWQFGHSCERQSWKEREDEVGRMENGGDLGGGNLVRDLIGWKQFPCSVRYICMRPLSEAACTLPDWPTGWLCLRLVGVLKDR